MKGRGRWDLKACSVLAKKKGKNPTLTLAKQTKQIDISTITVGPVKRGFSPEQSTRARIHSIQVTHTTQEYYLSYFFFREAISNLSNWKRDQEERFRTLCNMHTTEDVYHFADISPILVEQRRKWWRSNSLTEKFLVYWKFSYRSRCETDWKNHDQKFFIQV